MMTDKEAKKLDEIYKNEKRASNEGLTTQLLLHLIDKVSDLNASTANLGQRITDSNKRTDAKIASSSSKTELKLIKWNIGTAIALAGVIIAAIKLL